MNKLNGVNDDRNLYSEILNESSINKEKNTSALPDKETAKKAEEFSKHRFVDMNINESGKRTIIQKIVHFINEYPRLLTIINALSKKILNIDLEIKKNATTQEKTIDSSEIVDKTKQQITDSLKRDPNIKVGLEHSLTTQFLRDVTRSNYKIGNDEFIWKDLNDPGRPSTPSREVEIQTAMENLSLKPFEISMISGLLNQSLLHPMTDNLTNRFLGEGAETKYLPEQETKVYHLDADSTHVKLGYQIQWKLKQLDQEGRPSDDPEKSYMKGCDMTISIPRTLLNEMHEQFAVARNQSSETSQEKISDESILDQLKIDYHETQDLKKPLPFYQEALAENRGRLAAEKSLENNNILKVFNQVGGDIQNPALGKETKKLKDIHAKHDKIASGLDLKIKEIQMDIKSSEPS